LSQYGDHSCEIVVKFDFKSQSYGPETILLNGHAVTLTFKVAVQTLRARHRLNMLIISVKYFEIRLQITKLWTGNDFAARSCCDLDLKGSDPNVAHDMFSQYGDHSCEIVVKFDFKSQSNGPDTILLQGHALTLTFKVATQMLRATRHLNMVIISVKYF